MSNIDDSLAVWQQRLAAISTNANELADAESTKRIRIKLRAGNYSGLSKAKAEQATAQLSTLVDDYLLLAKIVDEALNIAQHSLFMSSSTREDKIFALLEGSSIVRTTGQVSIKNRDLLGSAAQSSQLTPAALLLIMQNEFEQARDSLNQLDLAESRGAEALVGIKHDYSLMEQRAKGLKAESDRPSFIEIQGLQADPLNALDGIEALRRSLSVWAAKLDDLERTRLSAEKEVEQAKLTLNELRDLELTYHSQCENLSHLCGAQTLSTLKMPGTSPIAMLQSWCETLENSLHAGQWSAVLVGMSRLQLAMTQAQADLNRAIAEVQTRCAEVDELKGRFAAYKAKDQTLIMQHGIDQRRQQLRVQIETDLLMRPLDLENLRVKVSQYQQQLSKII
ncbi:hypothetical protein H8K32_05585 [Undibacterium jejuense]|uniref:Uncharacterized protein n=1 Tax=Undibacterium jejuense TaxID=1344949 RepID=A0A923KPD5_9BURK|nr:hypothetical protein [Undibacterium jejuense]MBC3861566.1 hypothetical protein [Undibacterium jejuense]